MTEVRNYAIIGMSPGNSYFSEQNIEYLLCEVMPVFTKIIIFVPDIPAIATYEAMGYPRNRAKQKAILKGNNLKNKTLKIIRKLKIENQTSIVSWKTEIENNEVYEKCFKNIMNAFNSNNEFFRAINSTTKQVLLNTNKKITNIHDATLIANHYLLSELAFLEFANTYYRCDICTYIYHRKWPIFEDYIQGKFDGIPKNHLAFLLINSFT
jgi:cyclo(L-tyrosyl-L-tyrosyl) synthase